ncbi:O-acyltransferase WSD1-like [Dioscorea cayenensis subsp. rotundata]|uniref:O-acyltransferase WSD1-like n=1 Tax=Dioscorea cayennensis subsp. rotundata TaxID=55577 RepID=A0AB40AYP8_DIOCR|nr:O-acyltransferase WSD1-like [Dioscorea cayenensis subsp. rotundata]
MSSEPSGVLPRRRPSPIAIKKRNDGSGEEGKEEEKEKKGSWMEYEGEAEQPLSPAARLFHQPRFNCYIVAEMGIGTPIDVAAIKAGLLSTLVLHPRFSSVQILDESKGKKPKWVRTNVVIDNHIVIPNMDPNSNNPDQLVEDYVASLSNSPAIDLSRPLWDLHILNFQTSKASSVVILRIHHSLGDGTSLMSLLLACTRKTSNPDSPPSLPFSHHPPRSHPQNRLFAMLAALWAFLVLIFHSFVDLIIFTATAAFLNDSDTPFKGGDGTERHPKRFVHQSVCLDDIKIVKNAVGCTVNDVLLGVTSAGLTRYLYRKYESVNEKEKKKRFKSNIRLRSTVLVNIRPSPGIHALADMMQAGKCDAKWGNLMGYMILPFPIAFHRDPLDYVRKGKAIADRKKSSLEAIFTYSCAYMMMKLFGVKATAALSHRLLCHTSLSFSNIIGPVEEIGFYGHPLLYIAPSVYGHPQALTVHYQSYMNKMEIVLAVDESLIPDPHRLLDDLAESLQLIKDAAIAVKSIG